MHIDMGWSTNEKYFWSVFGAGYFSMTVKVKLSYEKDVNFFSEVFHSTIE